MSVVNDSAGSSPSPHVLIVGGGASGSTCALFLARAGIASTIFDHDRTILKRAYLHNMPGEDPILGVEWLAHLRKKIESFGLSSTVEGRVTSVSRNGNSFTAESTEASVSGDYLVIASGQVNIDFTESLGLEATDPVQPYVQANIVVDRWGATSVDDVFACGVVAGHPSQAVICAGSGATVAVRIVSLLRGEFWVDHDEAPRTAEADGD